MKKVLGVAAALLLLLGSVTAGFAQSADPVEIFYSVTNEGGTSWEYSYTFQNNSLWTGTNGDRGAMWFTTFFPVDVANGTSVYSNIQVLTPVDPADPWAHRTFAFQPFQANGYNGQWVIGGPRGMYDTQTIEPGAAILPGHSLSGFNVTFNYTGQGTPGPQSFEVVDSSFWTPETGWKIAANGETAPLAVPEPLSALMLACGLFGLVIKRRRAEKVSCAMFFVRR
jgi:hypothetical protein